LSSAAAAENRASGWTTPCHAGGGRLADGALYFTTGPTERKVHNLGQNSHCVITTGCNSLSEGLDLVATLQPVVDKFAAQYESPFRFTVGDAALYSDGREVLTE
jgi:hypothetical protein